MKLLDRFDLPLIAGVEVKDGGISPAVRNLECMRLVNADKLLVADTNAAEKHPVTKFKLRRIFNEDRHGFFSSIHSDPSIVPVPRIGSRFVTEGKLGRLNSRVHATLRCILGVAV